MDTVNCSNCGAPIPVGLPRDATVEAVTTDRDSPRTSDTARTATLECGSCGTFYVHFGVERSTPTRGFEPSAWSESH